MTNERGSMGALVEVIGWVRVDDDDLNPTGEWLKPTAANAIGHMAVADMDDVEMTIVRVYGEDS